MPNPGFLLTLKETKVVPPVDFPAARPEPPPKRDKDVDEEEQPKAPPKCHAFLQSYTGAPRPVNTANDEGNYVIIGQGFAATVNLATLLAEWGRKRIGERKVFFVGFPDPWRDYVTHNMNQEPELLTLPGYKNRPAVVKEQPCDAEGRWLSSDLFAGANRAEMTRFGLEAEEAGLEKYVLDAAVVAIKKHETKGYEIEIERGEPIYAQKIDICSGTGQQQLLDTATVDAAYGINMTTELWQEYLNPKPIDDGDWFPRVCAAEMYVRKNCKPKKGGAVCITGASPAGLQAGEHALCEDNKREGYPDEAAAEVFLVASRDINEGFLPIGRLDYHAVTVDGKALPKRQTNAVGKLKPTNPKVWFGEGYKVESIQPFLEAHQELFAETAELDFNAKLKGRLLVKFKGAGKKLAGQGGESDAAIVYGLFDQVALGSGRARGAARGKQAIGSALQLVESFQGELEPISADDYPFPVGLATRDGNVRILGAAGINNPVFLASMDKNELGLTPIGMFQRSLPVEARVNGEGVTLAAVTIAIANRFFKVTKNEHNRNVNTATVAELKGALGDKLGADAYYARHERIGPFTALRQLGHAIEWYRFDFGRYNFTSYVEDKMKAIVALDKELVVLRKNAEANALTIKSKETEKREIEKKLQELSEPNRPTFNLNDDPWLFREPESWVSFNERWLELKWKELDGGEPAVLEAAVYRYDEYFKWAAEIERTRL